MRFLADENFPLPTLKALQLQGYDVTWARMDRPGRKDVEILRQAVSEKRVLLTLDKDFRQLAIQESDARACGVILFRIHPATPERVTPVVINVLASRTDWAGHFSIVTEQAVQMIKLGSAYKTRRIV